MKDAARALRCCPKLRHEHSVHKQTPDSRQAFKWGQKDQDALHEAGKYLSGKPLVADGPQRQLAMGLPPSVLPLTAVLPVWIGVRLMLLAEALVLPRSASWLPTTVITPLASALMRLTYLLV
jgi:hypothetical protein